MKKVTETDMIYSVIQSIYAQTCGLLTQKEKQTMTHEINLKLTKVDAEFEKLAYKK